MPSWRAICACLVRERLVAGDSDEEVIEYIVSAMANMSADPRKAGSTLSSGCGPAMFLISAVIARGFTCAVVCGRWKEAMV